MRLSELSIRALPVPKQGQKIHWDGLPGFGVRVSQGGTRTFVLMHGANRQLTTIGRHPIITLAEARTKAKEILAKKTLGIERPAAPVFAEAIELFIAKHCEANNRPRTAVETARLLRTHFLPSFRHLPIDEIGARRVYGVLDDMMGRPSAARHAFVALRTFFRWCARRGLIDGSPIALMEAPSAPVSRERVLTDVELVAVYRQALLARCTGGLIVQLLVLTGQRRGEIGALRSEYIDEKTRTITLPRSLTKNGRTHVFPFGDMTAAVLKQRNRAGYLFAARGTHGERPYNGWSKLRTTVNPDIAPWTLHDLRRTFATHLASLNVPPHVIERLLNHAAGTISGVAAIYNRYSYLDEMRTAIVRWENYLAGLLAQE